MQCKLSETYMTQKTAIVVGATGVVGSALVKHLSEAEHIKKVVTLTRREVNNSSAKVENHIIDFDNLDASADLFKGDFLLSCLGTTRKQAGSVKAQRMVDLHYQYECAKHAAEQGVKHYFLVSSAGANRHSFAAYPKMKGELEYKVKQLGFDGVHIFQPSLLLGDRPEQRFGEEMAAQILPTLCKLPGLSKYRPITGQQVAQRMVAVSQNPKSGIEKFVLDDIFLT